MALVCDPRTLIAIVVVAWLPTPAAAQRFAPPPVDYDEESEQRSSFWESAIAADASRYDDAVERGLAYMKGGDAEAFDRARGELDAAIALLPDRPLAHYWRGKLADREDDFGTCATELGVVFGLDPSFVPPSAHPSPAWQLGYELASCRARSGDFEGAIDQYSRILAAGHSGISAVHWRLGEAYMALGRLGEAQDALHTALGLSGSADIRFSLAVALDRDERIAEAERQVELARARDPKLGSLLSTRRIYTPASDGHYYLGLAYLVGGERGRALFHFRRFLAVAETSPWAARARVHEAELGADPIGADLELRGSASLDVERARRAIAARSSELSACVRATPDALLSVGVTALARGRDAGSKVRPGVRVTVLDQAGTDTEALEAAVRCAEAVARDLALPRPGGAAGTYATLSFTLIFR